MNTLAITAPNMEQRLREKLAPTALQVLDESHTHDGHAGANGTAPNKSANAPGRKNFPSVVRIF